MKKIKFQRPRPSQHTACFMDPTAAFSIVHNMHVLLLNSINIDTSNGDRQAPKSSQVRHRGFVAWWTGVAARAARAARAGGGGRRVWLTRGTRAESARAGGLATRRTLPHSPYLEMLRKFLLPCATYHSHLAALALISLALTASSVYLFV
ncbi:unnamed protein product, partial [Brenthis ino]